MFQSLNVKNVTSNGLQVASTLRLTSGSLETAFTRYSGLPAYMLRLTGQRLIFNSLEAASNFSISL
jgi:hypothetical protein